MCKILSFEKCYFSQFERTTFRNLFWRRPFLPFCLVEINQNRVCLYLSMPTKVMLGNTKQLCLCLSSEITIYTVD